MHETIKNLLKIEQNVKTKNSSNLTSPKIVAVSKTFKIDHIMPLINHGHEDYGENKVQEAMDKWSDIKKSRKNIKLHLIGRLQTNKVKFAVRLFDYIHSLDSKKLADKIATQVKENNLNTKLFIQVNIGKENQKSGIDENNLNEFYEYCMSLNLNILGLMCIPPFNEDSTKYFKKMSELNRRYNFEELSMGMSSDYANAINYGSTYIRIGTDIFGKRT